MHRTTTAAAIAAAAVIAGAAAPSAGANVSLPACDRTDLTGFYPGGAIAGTLTAYLNGAAVHSEHVRFTGPAASYPLPAGLEGTVVVTFARTSAGGGSWTSDPRTCALAPAPSPTPPGEETPPGTPTTPATPTPPGPPARPENPRNRPTPPPRWRVAKVGPRVLTAGRMGTYTIRVRNVGRVALRNVTLRDRLPGGLALPRVPRGARLERGTLVWRIGRVAPGRTVTRRVRVLAVNTGARRACNVAVARVGVSAPRRARACTRIRVVVVPPAVTG